MKVFAALAVVVGTIMSLTPNTTGDLVAGAIFATVGLMVFFWPATHKRS